MAAGTKICKYCGAEYPACKTEFKPGVFRWRDVACCEEHAQKYLERVIASRSTDPAKEPEPGVVPDKSSVVLIEPEADGDDTIESSADENQNFIALKKNKRAKKTAEEPTE